MICDVTVFTPRKAFQFFYSSLTLSSHSSKQFPLFPFYVFALYAAAAVTSLGTCVTIELSMHSCNKLDI
jgi:hypothetical protein